MSGRRRGRGVWAVAGVRRESARRYGVKAHQYLPLASGGAVAVERRAHDRAFEA